MVTPSSPAAAFPPERGTPRPSESVTSLDTTTQLWSRWSSMYIPPPFQPQRKTKTTGITDKHQAPDSDFSFSEDVLVNKDELPEQ